MANGTPPVIDANCLGYWKFDENTGIIAADSGTGNHPATVHSAEHWPAWVAGLYGYAGDYALDFNGSSNFVKVAAPGANDYKLGNAGVGSAFSIEFLIKSTDSSGCVFTYDNSIGYYGWRISIGHAVAGKIVFVTISSAGGSLEYVQSAARIDDGNVHHLAIVWNKIQISPVRYSVKLYVDGVLDPSSDVIFEQPLVFDTNMGLFMGAIIPEGPGAYKWFAGTTDNPIIWNKALSDVEVLAHYNTFLGPPEDPTDLIASAISSSEIDLSWTRGSTDETGFKIERKTGVGGVYAQIDTVGAGVTTYQNNVGLDPGTEYYYRVRAYNDAGDSGYSNESNATTIPDPPLDPSALSATAISSSEIDLAWTAGSVDEDGFKIERKTGVGGVYAQIDTVGAGVTTYQNIAGLAPGTEYYYKVRAYNGGGDSGYSNEGNATTLSAGWSEGSFMGIEPENIESVMGIDVADIDKIMGI